MAKNKQKTTTTKKDPTDAMFPVRCQSQKNKLLYDSYYMTFKKRLNYDTVVKIVLTSERRENVLTEEVEIIKDDGMV